VSPAPLDLSEPKVPPRRTRWKVVAVLLLLGLLAPTPWLARRGASRLAFFHVRKVVVEGTRYLSPDSVVTRLALDTLHSVWDDAAPLEQRVLTLPQVATVSISRKLPGTLVVNVGEKLPVALVPGAQGLEPVDSSGAALPIDPAREALDLPVSNQHDVALIRMLAQVRARNAVLYRRISEVSRDGAGDVLLLLTSSVPASPPEVPDSTPGVVGIASSVAVNAPPMLRVRARVGVTAARLTDIFPVEFDLRRRGARVAELDLRYRDQVIARLQ
jgi:cell division protein FtsQ